MRARIIKEFRFEAAQTLPTLPSTHKCTKMHGHSFKVEIVIEGEVDPAIGWVYDPPEFSKAVKPLPDLLDPSSRNWNPWLEVSTLEYMAGLLCQTPRTQLPCSVDNDNQ